MDDTTLFLVELALRASVAASLREGDAAAVWGHYARLVTVSQSPRRRSLHEGLNWEGRRGGGVVLGVWW